MDKASKFEHPGVISKIEDGTIYIDIEVKSACSQCHAHSYCSAFGKNEKMIEVPFSKYPNLIIGNTVNVLIKETLGMQALLLGYIFPIIVLLIALFGSYHFTADEGISAIYTLFFVALYYLCLWLMRDKIKKHFTFELQKLE